MKASNGVIHAIDAVLVPPSLSQPPAPTQSIVQIAAGEPDFLGRSSRSSRRPAWSRRSQPRPVHRLRADQRGVRDLAKAAPATYAVVLADLALLAKVLTYHVDRRRHQERSGDRSRTAERHRPGPSRASRFSLSLKDGKLTLNGSATVVTADILATNGVIHVIDTVIVPPSLSA